MFSFLRRVSTQYEESELARKSPSEEDTASASSSLSSKILGTISPQSSPLLKETISPQNSLTQENIPHRGSPSLPQAAATWKTLESALKEAKEVNRAAKKAESSQPKSSYSIPVKSIPLKSLPSSRSSFERCNGPILVPVTQQMQQTQNQTGNQKLPNQRSSSNQLNQQISTNRRGSLNRQASRGKGNLSAKDVGRSPTFGNWSVLPPKILGVNQACPAAMKTPNRVWSLRDYEILGSIIENPGCKCHVARCKPSQCIVVLKIYSIPVLRDEPGGQDQERHLLQNIAIRCSLPHHPHILALHAAFREAAKVVLVEEYATGGDLLALLAESGGSLAEESAVKRVVQPMCLALLHLQGNGIMGRASVRPRCLLPGGPGADRVLKLLPDIDEAYTVAASSGGEGELRFTPLCQQLGGVCARLAVLTFRLLAGSQTLANPKSFEQFLVKHADQPRSSSDAGQLLEVQSKSYHQVTEAALCRRLAAAELPTNWSEEVRDFIHSALDASCTVASLLASPWVRIHSSLSPEGNYEGATAAMPLYTALSVVEDISGDEETVDRSLGDLSLVDSSLGVNGGVVAKPMFTGLEVPADNNSDDFQTCSVNLGCSVGPSYVDSESIIKGLGGVPDASAPDYAMYL